MMMVKLMPQEAVKLGGDLPEGEVPLAPASHFGPGWEGQVKPQGPLWDCPEPKGFESHKQHTASPILDGSCPYKNTPAA